MNLGQYINRLLLENDTVIIPGLGAFVSKYKSSEINEETGEISPPSKEISFNQQIRNNDGLLVGYVAENESLSHFDALKRIEKERENIEYQLDKGEKILLDETGILFLNDNLEIQFESLINENLLLDSFGLEPVMPNIDEFEEPEEINLVEDIEESEYDLTETTENQFDASDIQQENELLHDEVNDIFEIPAEVPEEEKAEPEIDSVFEPVISVVPAVKRKTNRLWYLMLLLPIVFAVVFVVANQSKKEKSKNNSQIPEFTEIIPEKIPENAINVNIAIDSVTINETKQNSTESNLNDQTKFYLVGGSFKEEENAQKFIGQFDVEGYEPFYMGKIGNFYCVGIGKFNSEGEAYQAKNEYKEKRPESETWVYEKK